MTRDPELNGSEQNLESPAPASDFKPDDIPQTEELMPAPIASDEEVEAGE